MEDSPLYQQIVESIRQEILSGKLRPGDRLPSIRSLTNKWDCTPGTVQRAYHELAESGLVVSRPGQGTHVSKKISQPDTTPLRRATLVNRAQAFLLEVLTSGYTPGEVETAMRLALDQWRTFGQEDQPPIQGALRFSGSHDLAIAWIAAHFFEIVPGFNLELNFSGSLSGLIALAEGQADIAGCHLWDQETDTYNVPFVRRVLPGRRIALVTMAHRRLGLVLPAGNPAGVKGLADIASRKLPFINRQAGSGTRVWLDAELRRLGIAPEEIKGYTNEKMTHSDVARLVAEGEAEAGIGLEAAALSYHLDFILLTRERYDLVIPEPLFSTPAVQNLIAWLEGKEAWDLFLRLGGYEAQDAGAVEWVG